MKVIIRSIPHKFQRYDTCGDYQEEDDGFTAFRISRLADPREMALIAIHELIEWALCQAKGITNDQIDAFDMDTSRDRNVFAEPGDDPCAPYYHAHQIATGVEKILAAEMGVDWTTYERHIEGLGK